MSVSYDTLGFTLTFNAAGSRINVGVQNAVALVGGYDANNAASGVSPNDAELIDQPLSAEDTFGDSELSRAIKGAASNRVSEIYGVAVAETQTTESFAATTDGSLSNTPIFDPRVQPEHEVTVTDTVAASDLSVQYVDVDPTTVSLGTDEAAVNPVEGTWATDSSSDYDITYTYGDYESAIQEAASITDARFVWVGTEAPSVKQTLQTQLADIATDFRFKRGVVGARPGIDAAQTGSYTPDVEDWRIIEVAPARATGIDGAVRTSAAVAGLLTAQPINVEGAITYDELQGLTSYATPYRPSQAEGFSQVTAVADTDTVAQAVTTSSTDQFSKIYAVEIVDFVGLGLKDVAEDYKGGPNLQNDKEDLGTDTRTLLDSYRFNAPPLLATGDGGKPYAVSTSEGASRTETDLNVGIEVAPIMEEIDLNINVGSVVTFGGASA